METRKPEDGTTDQQPTAPLSGPRGPWAGPFTPPAGYEIVGEIGRGGMGVVYKARQKMPCRIGALKVMLQGTLSSEEEKKRFLLEANATPSALCRTSEPYLLRGGLFVA